VCARQSAAKHGGEMKNCTDCKHAEWHRTAAGKLHPSGDGKCTYPFRLPPLPACMCWTWGSAPTPIGGSINRREELRDHCTYYARKDTHG
jgi:hypothetical protein